MRRVHGVSVALAIAGCLAMPASVTAAVTIYENNTDDLVTLLGTAVQKYARVDGTASTCATPHKSTNPSDLTTPMKAYVVTNDTDADRCVTTYFNMTGICTLDGVSLAGYAPEFDRFDGTKNQIGLSATRNDDGDMTMDYTIPAHATGTILVQKDGSDNDCMDYTLRISTDKPITQARPAVSASRPYAGNVLSATDPQWLGSPPLTTSRQWRRCASDGTGCADIAGQTSTSYTATTQDIGKKLVMRSIAIDPSGTTTSDSLPFAILGLAPSPKVRRSVTSGAAFTPGTNALDFGAALTITAPLQFPVWLFGRTVTSLEIDSYGAIALPGVRLPSLAIHGCGAPDARFGDVLFPWYAGPGMGLDDGIFTAVTGSAPRRTLTIEWRYASVNFEVQLHEDEQTFSYIYGSLGTPIGDEYVGWQLTPAGPFDEYLCQPNAQPSSGTRIDYAADRPQTPAAAQSGTPIGYTNLEWTGMQPITYTQRWQLCGGAGGPCADVAGATSATYTPAASDVGKYIRVIVTAANQAGSGTAPASVPVAVSAGPAAPPPPPAPAPPPPPAPAAPPPPAPSASPMSPPPPAPTPCVANCTAPVTLTALKIRPATFRVKGVKPRTKAARTAKQGTTITFSLSGAAKLTFTVSVKKKGKFTRSGSFTANAKAGHNTVAFAGKIKSKPLAAGSYRLSAQVGSVKPSTVTFTIVR